MNHIGSFYFHCLQLIGLSGVCPLHFHQFGILLTVFSILLNCIARHLSLFQNPLSRECDHGLPGRLGLSLVVAQSGAQVILHVESNFFVIVITLVVDFTLLKYGDLHCKNVGSWVERGS